MEIFDVVGISHLDFNAAQRVSSNLGIFRINDCVQVQYENLPYKFVPLVLVELEGP